MKRLIISESERKDILRKHGTVIYEQTADEKLRQIQQALGTSGDKVIGPDTTKKIVDALKSVPKEDFGCVSNLKNEDKITYVNKKETFEVEVIDMTMTGSDGKPTGGMEYQIDDILFKPNGTYFDLNQPNTPLKYNCNGTTIQTSNHGNFEKVNPEVSSDGEKKDETVSDKKGETVSGKNEKDNKNIEASNNLRNVSSHEDW